MAQEARMVVSRTKPIPYGGYHVNRIPDHDPQLTETGPGTAMGEYMRRFWHPVCMSEELTDVPRYLRILGEDLVAFRDKSGRVGVLHLHCAHRGASLEYAMIQERGIMCCYHGFVFDVDGTCLQVPFPPGEETRGGQGAPDDLAGRLQGARGARPGLRLHGAPGRGASIPDLGG